MTTQWTSLLTSDQFLAYAGQPYTLDPFAAPATPPWDNVVIFGGDRAELQCADEAVRLGIGRITCYLPCRLNEIGRLLEEQSLTGIERIHFIDLVLPVGFIENAYGSVSAVRCVHLRPAGWGQSQPLQPLVHSSFIVRASGIILGPGMLAGPTTCPFSLPGNLAHSTVSGRQIA